MIRVPQVRVVDEDGAQLGVLPTGEALRLAQERGYDLVEVAPTASPPVVKLLDFGQYKYELAKREKEAKRRSRSVEFKEIRLKPKIGSGDFDTKVHRAIQFLEEGDRIKVTVQFRGRELTHPEIGRNLLARFTDRVKDHGILERAPLLEGRAMHIIIASSHKPKMREAAPGHPDTAHAKTPEETPVAATAAPVAEAAPASIAETPVAATAAPAPTATKPVAEAAPKAVTKKPVADAATVPPAAEAAPKATTRKPVADAATKATAKKPVAAPAARAAEAAPASIAETPVAATAPPAADAAPAPIGE
jgi:translation initiation factor IF-3